MYGVVPAEPVAVAVPFAVLHPAWVTVPVTPKLLVEVTETVCVFVHPAASVMVAV